MRSPIQPNAITRLAVCVRFVSVGTTALQYGKVLPSFFIFSLKKIKPSGFWVFGGIKYLLCIYLLRWFAVSTQRHIFICNLYTKQVKKMLNNNNAKRGNMTKAKKVKLYKIPVSRWMCCVTK